MKSTGIVRQVDQLGRVVLPIELRRTMGINEKDPMEVFVDGENIVLRPYQSSCIMCPENDQTKMIIYNGKYICINCISKINTQVNI